MIARALAPAILIAALAACAPAVAPGADAASGCATDADCDDGLFCNGAEACAPDAGTADARGCVGAAAPPCEGTCEEAENRCADRCADRDGDGAGEPPCGDDCDDEDANRFPGNAEVCDVAGHDEDCDASTVGARDYDDDGFVDDRCCNGASCGDDCDDASRYVHRTNPELCDRVDNDCDDAIDEEILPVRWYRDADGDLAGDPDDWVEACRPQPGRVLDSRDCDDDATARNPRARETCDGVDEDCDESVDEGLGPDVGVICNVEGAHGACAEGVTRCDGTGGIVCFPTVTPGPETCDGRDEDCDAAIDEDAPGVGAACTVAGASGACAAGRTRCGGASGLVCEGPPPGAELCTPANENCDPGGGGYDGLECVPGTTRPCDFCATPRIVGTQTCRSVCTFDYCVAPPVDSVFDATTPGIAPVAPLRGHAEGSTWVVRFDEVRPESFASLTYNILSGPVALAPGRYRVTGRGRWDGTTPDTGGMRFGMFIAGDTEATSMLGGGVMFDSPAGTESLLSSTFDIDRCLSARVWFWTYMVRAPATGTITFRDLRLVRLSD